ncbi:uncharacterized protein LOC129565526 isoform X2 [Sitodiplosis mosellana]|nr:uncharacterized protein LOC129565526 isoform X2 [Sitodiplosis mosellana]
MHCLVWHYDHFPSGITLPQNSMVMTSTLNTVVMTSVQMPVMTSAPKTLPSDAKTTSDAKTSVTLDPMAIITSIPKTSPVMPTSIQPPKEKKQKLDITIGQSMFAPIINNLKCSTCAHPFLTQLGINMHQRYHRFNLFLPKLKKMSDIETLDELKQILEISDEIGDEKGIAGSKLPLQRITNKENTPVRNTIIEAKRLERLQQQQQQQQVEQSQKQQQKVQQPQRTDQWAEMLKLTKVNITKNLQQFQTLAGVQKIIDMVDNAMPIQQIMTNVRDTRKRPLSPAGSVVSISSDESAIMENNEMDYSYDEVDIDIEF